MLPKKTKAIVSDTKNKKIRIIHNKISTHLSIVLSFITQIKTKKKKKTGTHKFDDSFICCHLIFNGHFRNTNNVMAESAVGHL